MAKKIGKCTNIDCENYNQEFEIDAGEEFICPNPKCGQPLKEVTRKRANKANKKLIGIIAGVVVVLAIIGGIFVFGGGEEQPEAPSQPVVAEQPAEVVFEQEEEIPVSEPQPESSSEVVEEQETEVAAEAKAPAAASSSSASSGTKDLGYAVFKGKLKNGQPDDVNGRLEFKESHQIDSRDPRKRVAEAGDYVIGEFSEGHLVQGIWYGADNQVKGSVIIGK